LQIRIEPAGNVSPPCPSPPIDPDGSPADSISANVEKALVVDDEPDVLESTAQIMELMGYEVLTATSGKQALEIISRVPEIDLLLTDVVMPGIDGYTLAKEARKLAPELVIIMVSGFPKDHLRQHQRDLESFSFLMKPFRIAEIARLVRRPE
jgi:CheY-like chemotaxis protein